MKLEHSEREEGVPPPRRKKLFKMNRKPLSKSKTTIVQCRYSECGHLKLNRQSYKDHLIKVHKDKSNNLREHGEPVFSFGRKTPATSSSQAASSTVETNEVLI